MATAHIFSKAKVAFIGVSLMALVGAQTPVMAVSAADGMNSTDDKAEQKTEKRTVKIIMSGQKPRAAGKRTQYVVITKDDDDRHEHAGDDGKSHKFYGVRSEHVITDGGVTVAPPQTETVRKITESLAVVESRLKKSRKKAEKKALQAAREGLVAALETLENRARMPGGALRALEGSDLVFLGANGLNGEGASGDRRHIEVLRDMVELGVEARVLRDMDIEINLGDGQRVFKFKSAGPEMLGAEGQLKALKEAEKELAQAREQLEKQVAEEKKKAAKANK
jgi:hypothetical protein